MNALFRLFLLTLPAAADQLPVNSVSENQNFALRNGSAFTNSSLDAYEGKILVLMMMTPWCPFCQSNAQAVGDGILDPFNAASRGVLRGKNNQGIEIRSLLLSTEPASQWDNTNSTFASSNGYQQWGLDANAQRQSPRVMLGYYRGGYPNNINSSNLYDWGDDRRRVVVLSLVRNSASHQYRGIVINQNAFTSANAATAQALINAIQAPPPTVTFNQWAGTYPFTSGDSDPEDDPDKDGSNNVWEFFHGTHPLQARSRDSGPIARREGTRWIFIYRRARNIGGFALEYQSANETLDWQALGEPPVFNSIDLGTVEEIAVTLPASADPVRLYQLAITLPD